MQTSSGREEYFWQMNQSGPEIIDNRRGWSIIKGAFLLVCALIFITSCEPENPEPEDPKGNDDITGIYEVFEMNIQVNNNAPVISKDPADYLNCSISINGKGILDNYNGTARIRGRGNSSWLWYDKKPYRIKLDASSRILGLKSNSDWVLLANYRDPTDLMNVFGFEISSRLGLPYTNHSRFVEVTLNGDYIGLYQLTEQIEQGGNRVPIDELNGVLISLDLDDGPELSPGAGNNFSSSLFELPVSVKYPEAPTSDQLIAIRYDFAKLEDAINNYDYDAVAELMDIPSFINYMIVQELVYNVEVAAPRSIFMFKDAGGKYVWGPVWDFDAGFDFDWGTMTTGHNFFNAQELVLGTDPGFHPRVSNFFTQMFRNNRFVQEYKARWAIVEDQIFNDTWEVMEKYEVGLKDALARDFKRWPIDKNFTTETNRMENWLSDRVTYLGTVINNYPGGSVPTTKIDCGTITCDVTMSYLLGYGQTVTVEVNDSSLLSMLGITAEQLNSGAMRIVPLKTDGTEGMNNTNGSYGGWFEGDNNPGFWANGHVYIEVFNDLTSWACGIRAEEGFCSVGEHHSVRMQYQYTQGLETKTVTVIVNFTIDP
jgi:hypothetical protein